MEATLGDRRSGALFFFKAAIRLDLRRGPFFSILVSREITSSTVVTGDALQNNLQMATPGEAFEGGSRTLETALFARAFLNVKHFEYFFEGHILGARTV